MATLTPDKDNAEGDVYAGRALNDYVDPKDSSGTYTPTERKWDATTAYKIMNELLLLHDIGNARTARNNTGSTIDPYTLVYLTWDNTNSVMQMNKADADDPALVATHITTESVLTATTSLVVPCHLAADIDTSSFSSQGVPLYLSATAGLYTETAPTGADQFVQKVGVVRSKHATTGSILFFIQPARKFGSAAIQTSSVSVAKLDDTVQDLIPTLATITKDTEGTVGADIIRFSLQARDANGNNLAQEMVIRTWVGTADKGGAAGSQVIGIGAAGGIIDSDLLTYANIVTNSSGVASVDVTVTGAGTRYFMAEINGKVYSLSATWA